MKTPETETAPVADPLAEPRFARVLDALHNLPEAQPAPGFADRVCQAAARSNLASRWPTFLRLAAAAAVLALLVQGAFWAVARFAPSSSTPSVAVVPSVPSIPVVPSPLDTLLASQRPDGAWGPAPDATRYDPAVTALALLALCHHDGNPLASPHASAFSAGVERLLAAQRPDGAFAAASDRAPSSNYLAVKALEAAAFLPGADPAWTRALALARPHLPPPAAVAALNRSLAFDSPDAPWTRAGGPALQSALLILRS